MNRYGEMNAVMKHKNLLASAVVVLAVLSGVQASAESLDELLLRMPARDANEADWVSYQLIEAGDGAIGGLCDRLLPPGGDDAAVRFAVNGLAKYVSTGLREEERELVANSIVQAIRRQTDADAKAFLIRQLEVAGGNESVPSLGAYLSNERLCDPAASALVAIGTQDAAEALAAALPDARGACIGAIAKSLGELRHEASAPVLIEIANGEDPQSAALARYALANMGAEDAETLLREAMEVESVVAQSNAVSDYLLYIEQRAANGDKREARKLAKETLALFDAPEDVSYKCAALALLVQLEDRSALDALLDAMDSEGYQYRGAALLLANRITGARATSKWVRKLSEVDAPRQVEILHMLGSRRDDRALDAVLDHFDSSELEVRVAAYKAATSIGGAAVAPALVAALDDAEGDEVETIKAALMRVPLDDLVGAAGTDSANETVKAVLEARNAGYDPESGEDFVSLFNGENLDGWIGDTEGYRVEEGVLYAKDEGGVLLTEQQYSDFVFRFDFNLPPGGNSGIGIRVEPGTHASYDGIEIQVLDHHHEMYKDIQPWQYHGSVYGIVPAEHHEALKPAGEWNSEEITVQGTHYTVVLNGVTIVDADIAEAAKPQPVDGKEHPGITRTEGHIGLLGHHSPVAFRNLQVKKLQ